MAYPIVCRFVSKRCDPTGENHLAPASVSVYIGLPSVSVIRRLSYDTVLIFVAEGSINWIYLVYICQQRFFPLPSNKADDWITATMDYGMNPPSSQEFNPKLTSPRQTSRHSPRLRLPPSRTDSPRNQTQPRPTPQ